MRSATDGRRMQHWNQLPWFVGIGGAGLALSALYAATGVGVGCPFKAITGWDCPLCGGTRMGAALLQGDVAAAFWFNPVALAALPIATVVAVVLAGELITGRPGRTAAALRRLASRRPAWWTAGWTLGTLVTLMAVWVVVRNLLLGPLP